MANNRMFIYHPHTKKVKIIAQFSPPEWYIQNCDKCFTQVLQDFFNQTSMPYFKSENIKDQGYILIDENSDIDWLSVQFIVGACEEHIEEFNKTNDMLKLFKNRK